MFTATAATCAAGTPPLPSTATSTVAGPRTPAPARARPSVVAVPSRVSSNRWGATAENSEPTGNQPSTSTSRWAEPACWNSRTVPSPTPTITLLATVAPGTRFTLLVPGCCSPPGNAVTYDTAVASVAVTLSTTAATPVRGTPPRPRTDTSMVVAGPTGPAPLPAPSTVGAPERVSSKRAGARPTNRGDAAAARPTRPSSPAPPITAATANVAASTVATIVRMLTLRGSVASMRGKNGLSPC